MSDQRTPEWFAERCGKVTASRVSEVMSKLKSGGYAQSREDYMAQLVIERITSQPVPSYTNSFMQWGTDQEPFARAAYEAHRGVLVDEVGFIPHPHIAMAGASPDGLVEDGLVEIKCMTTANHIDAMLNGTIAKKYVAQMQMQMACTNRAWCDFVSFDPRMPAKAQLWIKRIERDNKFIDEMDTEIVKFLAELDEKVRKLQTMIGE